MTAAASAGQAARAAPDGYTVLFVFGSFEISPILSKISCDPRRDFARHCRGHNADQQLEPDEMAPRHAARVGERDVGIARHRGSRWIVARQSG